MNHTVPSSTKHGRMGSTVNRVYVPIPTKQSTYTLPVFEMTEHYFYKIDGKISAKAGSL